MASFGSTAWVAAEAISSIRPLASWKSAQGVPVQLLQARDRAAAALGVGGGRRPQRGLGLGRVALGGPEAVALDELEHSLPHPVGLQLVGQHRGDRDRQPLGGLEHRQVRASHGVEQPLLAEGIGAEPLDVGHVAVQDDRKVADRLVLAHLSQTPTKSRARSRSFGESLKSDELIAGMKRS